MKPLAIFLILFWIILIIFPEIIAYILGWLLIFIWVNMVAFLKTKKNKHGDDYVKFWKYKIYR